MANLELEAGELEARGRAFSLDFAFAVPGIWAVVFAAFVLRLALAFFPGFGVDIGSFTAWSARLADLGPWDFYSPDYFSDYAPGYLYVLWLFGELNRHLTLSPGEFEYLLKMPPTIADVASVYLLYRLLEGRREGLRLAAAAAYAFFPAALLVGPIWGQVDSLSAFFLLLSVYMIVKDRLPAAAVAYVVGFVIKPQIVAAFPFLAFWIMKEHPPKWLPPTPEGWLRVTGWALVFVGAGGALAAYMIDSSQTSLQAAGGLAAVAGGALVAIGTYAGRGRELDAAEGRREPAGIPVPPAGWTAAGLAGFAALVLLIYPFFPGAPWDFVDQLRRATEVDIYRVTSFWAYNFWGFVGFFKSDGQEYLFLSYRHWGLLMFAVAVAGTLFALKDVKENWGLALGTALCTLAFYVFLTRMHERYMFPVFLPLLAACVLRNHPALWWMLGLLSLLHFVNLYHVYMWYNDNELRWEWLFRRLEDPDFLGTGLEARRALSLPMWLSFPMLLATTYLLARSARRAEHPRAAVAGARPTGA
jgi:Gpi18-like mannosyltransferase